MNRDTRDWILNYSCMYNDGEMRNESSGFFNYIVITFALNQNISDVNSFYSDFRNISLPMKNTRALTPPGNTSGSNRDTQDGILNYSCLHTDGEMRNESSGFSYAVVITFASTQNSFDGNSFYSDFRNISLPMKNTRALTPPGNISVGRYPGLDSDLFLQVY
jgi:hypothetical protein